MLKRWRPDAIEDTYWRLSHSEWQNALKVWCHEWLEISWMDLTTVFETIHLNSWGQLWCITSPARYWINRAAQSLLSLAAPRPLMRRLLEGHVSSFITSFPQRWVTRSSWSRTCWTRQTIETEIMKFRFFHCSLRDLVVIFHEIICGPFCLFVSA